MRIWTPLFCLFIGISGAARADEAPATQPVHPFRDNVKVEVTEELLIIRSDGIPDHETGHFPNRDNPNEIRKQNYTFRIPRHPQIAGEITPLPMGPIGVAVNGVPFYNPYNAEGQDATMVEVFDRCCGHPDPRGRYHYHIFPRCLHTSFTEVEGEHSSLLGFAFDGFAIFGPNGEGGEPPEDLDECNGHSDDIRGYHYHVSREFPYILGGYRGIVEKSNLDRGPGDGGGRGGPPGNRPPRGRRPPPP